MKTLFVQNIIVIVLLLTIPSCSIVKQDNQYPDVGVSSNELNSKFILLSPEGITDKKIGATIDLIIQNISNTTIALPPGYGVKIFIRQDHGWEEVNNNFGYTAITTILPPKSGNNLGGNAVPLKPVIKNNGQAVEIRVYVIGNVYRNDIPTPAKTGAFIDLTLQP